MNSYTRELVDQLDSVSKEYDDLYYKAARQLEDLSRCAEYMTQCFDEVEKELREVKDLV